MQEILNKYEMLKKHVGAYPDVAVAFSGGVDSTLVLKVCEQVFGDRVVAITADNPALPREELKNAKQIAKSMKVNHVVLKTHEIGDKNYRSNPTNRCYFCKKELYGRIDQYLRSQQLLCVILNGTNADDLQDYRPGLQAAEEGEVRSPLAEGGWTKEEVRTLARSLDLPVWDKPSSPCLASRIPYHQEVTTGKLASIEQAENLLRRFNIRQLRVRHFGEKARIEVDEDGVPTLVKHWSTVEKEFGKLGFQTVHWTLFKSGSLNVLNNGSQ